MAERTNQAVILLKRVIPDLSEDVLTEAYKNIVEAITNNRVGDIDTYLNRLEQTRPECVKLLTEPLNSLPPGKDKEVVGNKAPMAFMRQSAQESLQRR